MRRQRAWLALFEESDAQDRCAIQMARLRHDKHAAQEASLSPQLRRRLRELQRTRVSDLVREAPAAQAFMREIHRYVKHGAKNHDALITLALFYASDVLEQERHLLILGMTLLDKLQQVQAAFGISPEERERARVFRAAFSLTETVVQQATEKTPASRLEAPQNENVIVLQDYIRKRKQ